MPSRCEAERCREEERAAVLAAFATPRRCIPLARAAVLLECPCSFRLSGSRTQRRVLAARDVTALRARGKNAAAQACLNVGPTGNSQQPCRIE